MSPPIYSELNGLIEWMNWTIEWIDRVNWMNWSNERTNELNDQTNEWITESIKWTNAMAWSNQVLSRHSPLLSLSSLSPLALHLLPQAQLDHSPQTIARSPSPVQTGYLSTKKRSWRGQIGEYISRGGPGGFFPLLYPELTWLNGMNGKNPKNLIKS